MGKLNILKTSLLFKFIFIILSVTFIVVIIFGFYFYVDESRKEMKQFEINSNNTAERFALNISYSGTIYLQKKLNISVVL